MSFNRVELEGDRSAQMPTSPSKQVQVRPQAGDDNRRGEVYRTQVRWTQVRRSDLIEHQTQEVRTYQTAEPGSTVRLLSAPGFKTAAAWLTVGVLSMWVVPAALAIPAVAWLVVGIGAALTVVVLATLMSGR